MRDYGETYIQQYQPDLHKIKLVRAMRICKTPALGGKVIHCNRCKHEHYVYFSCGHSHCPICQSIKRQQWVDKLRTELYNVPYVHVTFTLPHELNRLARSYPNEIYGLLMRISWKTIKHITSQDQNIGALPGMVSVLHTFGSDMKHHIHTHNLVTFGGLKQGKWVYPKRKYKLARYRQMCSTFRKLFLHGLKQIWDKNKINYHHSYETFISAIKFKRWVVHNTYPTMDTKVIETYLARYINRIAISNSRLKYYKQTRKVEIIYNDYRNQKTGQAAPKAKKKLNPLSAIHQILQHVLPPYFQKSRRYGIHAGATKKRIQKLVPESIKRNGGTVRTVIQILSQLLKNTPYRCEICKSTDHEIQIVKPNKNWIHKYIHVPKSARPPPMNKNIYYAESI